MKHIMLRPNPENFGVLCERLCRHPSVSILHDTDTQLRFELDPEMTETEAMRLADMLVEGQVFPEFLESLKGRDLKSFLEIEIQRGRNSHQDLDTDIVGADEAGKTLQSLFPVYEDIHSFTDTE